MRPLNVQSPISISTIIGATALPLTCIGNDRGECFHIAAQLARTGRAAVPMRKPARSENQREFSLQVHSGKRFPSKSCSI